MPVVRNSQFYFREGFCWNNVLNPNARLLKTKLKLPTVNDVGSMSLIPINNLIPCFYFVILLNSNLIFDYYREFINCTVNIQINDIRQIPIIIPKNQDLVFCEKIFNKIVEIKNTVVEDNNQMSLLEKELDNFINTLYSINISN